MSNINSFIQSFQEIFVKIIDSILFSWWGWVIIVLAILFFIVSTYNYYVRYKTHDKKSLYRTIINYFCSKSSFFKKVVDSIKRKLYNQEEG